MIMDEVDEIRMQKANVSDTLELLYNLRINNILCLHPEYRGLIPISVIYGYFDTGRCSQLQGHEGAYNLYEDEKMKKMIIDKLDNIGNKLDELNGTMIYVGQAIEDCNERLAELDRNSEDMMYTITSMNKKTVEQLAEMNSNSKLIEQQVANVAYYTEIGAKMTAFNTAYNLLNS